MKNKKKIQMAAFWDVYGPISRIVESIYLDRNLYD